MTGMREVRKGRGRTPCASHYLPFEWRHGQDKQSPDRMRQVPYAEEPQAWRKAVRAQACDEDTQGCRIHEHRQMADYQ